MEGPNLDHTHKFTETACVGGKEWYFYSQRDRKYATGLRTNRATVSGYWKATGKDRPIARKGTLVGMRKTLVFYQGRAPKGRKSDWVMHEFRHEGQGPLGPGPPKIPSLKEDWVLCRVFYKNREGPASAKQVTMGSYGETIISSSSLPPLMDSYITFDQTQSITNTDTIHDDQYDDRDINTIEQVPCFSIFTSPDHQINHPTFPDHNYITQHTDMMIMEPNTSSTKTNYYYSPMASTFGAMAPELLGSCNLGPFSCDKKVLHAVLSHLTKMDSSPNYMKLGSPSLGEGISSESFLSDHAGSSPLMWNH